MALASPSQAEFIGRPGVTALLVQTLLDIEDRPLPSAVKFVQLVTRDRDRNRQPRSYSHDGQRPRGRRTGWPAENF